MIANDSDVEERIERRATYERFSMTVCRNGVVNIRNDSYGDESGKHIYTVNPAEGTCTCPHATYRGARCKHLTAVENSPIVVSSSSLAAETYNGRTLTDGGEPEESEPEDDRSEELPEITHHREPEKVGGERYARCEGCENESIFGKNSILHDDDCLRADTIIDDEGDCVPRRSEQPDMGGGESTGVVDLS